MTGIERRQWPFTSAIAEASSQPKSFEWSLGVPRGLPMTTQLVARDMLQAKTGISASAQQQPEQITYIPQGNSAATVSRNSVSDYGYDDVLDRIRQISESNTAQSAGMAAELRDWQTKQNKKVMDFNAAEAQKNRDWQEMMSNTAHQREIADLQAAGLNPVLSAMGGNGASVTSGATASATAPSGAKGEVDQSFALSMMNFLNNIMGYATTTAAAGINAGATLGAANIGANASIQNAQTAASAAILGHYLSADASKYGTDKSYAATIAGHQNAKDIAKMYNDTSKSVAWINFTSRLLSDAIGVLPFSGSGMNKIGF